MKILAGFTALWIVLTVLGWTVYFHADADPWGGWFAPLWFGSLGGAVLSLVVVGITRAVSEIASGEVALRRLRPGAGSGVGEDREVRMTLGDDGMDRMSNEEWERIEGELLDRVRDCVDMLRQQLLRGSEYCEIDTISGESDPWVINDRIKAAAIHWFGESQPAAAGFPAYLAAQLQLAGYKIVRAGG